jgi:hypothetical protein
MYEAANGNKLKQAMLLDDYKKIPKNFAMTLKRSRTI